MSRKPDVFTGHPAHFIQPVYRGWCHDVIDGDTVILELDIGFNEYRWVSCRLFNLNAPEIYRPTTPLEQHAAIAAKTRLQQLVQEKPVLVVTYKDKDKYGRYLASLFYYAQDIQKLWHSVEDQLVREGHAAWLDTTIPPPSLE